MALFDSFFGQGEEEELPVEQPLPVGIENPLVKDYLMAQRQKIADQNTEDAKGPNVLASLAALGAGLQGGDAASAGQNFLKGQQAQRDAKLTQFDDAAKFAKAEREDVRSEESRARESDPNSQESKIAQEVAIEMGMSPLVAKKLTAEQWKSQGPMYQKAFEVKQRKLDRGESALLRRDAQEDRKIAAQEKKDEKTQALKTPYGLANTPEDAKQLKEAHESKQNFDSKIKEMIALREAKGGGASFDREAVARGKQLSKDLLLEYKNMAKLGVLSQSDEKIINAIIPEDPLAYRSPLEAISKQDSILSNLKKFQSDSEKDFANRVATRTRSGLADYANGKSPNTAPSSSASMKPLDAEALKWVEENPNDPRAAAILKRLGV